MIKVLKVLFAIFLIILMVPGIPVLAVAQPASTSITNILVTRNLAETGDVSVAFHYSITYNGSYPDTPADTTTIIRILDTDNTTVLQTGDVYVNPFFNSNGYGEGTAAFYFSASDNYTWGAATTIQIVLLPGFFSPASTKSYSLTPSNYVSETTQDANRELLKTFILSEADDLETAYQSTGIILHATSDVGIVLSSYGELYFRSVFPGLQSMVPTLFFVQSLVPEVMAVQEYDSSTEAALTARLASDDLGEGFTNMGALLNMSGGLFAGLLCFVGTIGISIWTNKKGWGTEIGLAVSAFLVIGLAMIVGSGLFTAVMVGSLVAGIGVVWILLLKRA